MAGLGGTKPMVWLSSRPRNSSQQAIRRFAMRDFPDFGQTSPGFTNNPGRKLLVKARGSTSKAQYHALASYLNEAQDIGLLEDILVPFETKNPLKLFLENREMYTPLEMRNLCQPVLDSARYLLELYTAISVTEPFLSKYKLACFPLILSRWSSITGWFQTLLWIRYTDFRGSLSDAGNEFFKGFGMVLASYLGTDCSEELYSMPCTIDFLYFALRQLDFWNGKTIGKQTSYIILDVINDSLKTDSTRSIMSSRFGTLSKAAQRGIVSSLLSRAKDFGDAEAKLEQWAPHGVSLVANLTNSLVDMNPSAHRLFHQRNFDFQYSTSLCNLVKKAIASKYQDEQFWGFVAGAVVGIYLNTAHSPNRGNSLAAAVEGGLLFCSFACLQKYPGTNHLVTGAFRMAKDATDELCHRYMCISKVYLAVVKWHTQLEGLLPALKRIKGLEQLCSVYPESFSQSSGAFVRPRVAVPCNHAPIHSQNSNGALKTCSSCRSVVYCSAACQEKDWTQFHKLECPRRTQVYKDQLAKKTWASREMRRDRLSYIDLLLNSLLDASASQAAQLSLEPTHILTFDLCTSVGVGIAKLSFEDWKRSTWNRGPDAEVWLPRCESFIKEMQTDNTIRLAEFIFFNDLINVEVVLAKVQEQDYFGASLSSQGQYSVLSTISRICTNRAVHDMWQNMPPGTVTIIQSSGPAPRA
ncbi:hypothetical protein MD484_g270, partial [Candolleomyces efflorescens]